MAEIRPFAGIHYARRPDLDLAKLIAPPYDVLDEAGKAALQAKDARNIVTVDLPHLPAKAAGPDAVYQQANQTLRTWMAEGTLARDMRPALYPYTQSYELGGRTFHRRGLIALVRLSPFGAGAVVPHEKTYRGPIEDRLKLMHATGAQLSPIFGLYSDPRNEVTNLLYRNLAKPLLTGTLDGVRNDMWAITDNKTIADVIDLMKQKPVYIADGHHRYTTALQYEREIQQQMAGALPPDHPAHFCMFVLIGMQDPGLAILPTHRLIGGLSGFDIGSFRAAAGQNIEVTESPLMPDRMGEFARSLTTQPAHTFGLYDGRNRKLYVLRLRNADVLKSLEPQQSEAWRALDVAILHRYLIDEVLKPGLAGGSEISLGYTADPETIAPQVDGSRYQIAMLLQPTPLHALEELGRHGEVMPQKSTYFFPKLATGMVLNPLG